MLNGKRLWRRQSLSISFFLIFSPFQPLSLSLPPSPSFSHLSLFYILRILCSNNMWRLNYISTDKQSPTFWKRCRINELRFVEDSRVTWSMTGEQNLAERSNGGHRIKPQQKFESSGGSRWWAAEVPWRQQTETEEKLWYYYKNIGSPAKLETWEKEWERRLDKSEKKPHYRAPVLMLLIKDFATWSRIVLKC